MKELLLTLYLVSLSFLLLVNVLLFTKANWMRYQRGRHTRIGHMFHYPMVQRLLRRTYRNNSSFSKVTKRLFSSSTKTKRVSWRRRQWLLSYQVGKLKLLTFRIRTRMLLMLSKLEIQRRYAKLYGMLRRINRMASSMVNRFLN